MFSPLYVLYVFWVLCYIYLFAIEIDFYFDKNKADILFFISAYQLHQYSVVGVVQIFISDNQFDSGLVITLALLYAMSKVKQVCP